MQNLHRIPRLYSDRPLGAGLSVTLDADQSRYLIKVMRLKAGSQVRLFNGAAGEWLCTIGSPAGKSCPVECDEQLAAPGVLPDIDYLFAPLKSARLDYLAQKATEMGARRLRPVITEHTVVRKVNIERLAANAREAAEQCNMVALPEVCAPEKLETVLAKWDPARRLIFCDEAAPQADPLKTLGGIAPGPLALLIGPEGGFSPAEQAGLRELPFVTPISLGPRIMRADTAAVAAMAIVQAVLGDWPASKQD
ncbi:MAG: 16S rRNA (uracil(1498)-N(3))-methyltransferase [Rhizobiales bacterium]|nr:16S rRNA (uracil(1498)-N(3))-methyltransferase [Hyphomicrobiales bacterium]